MLTTQALLDNIEYLRENIPTESIPIYCKTVELIDPGHGGFINGEYVTAPRKMYDHGLFTFYEGLWNRAIAWAYAAELYQNSLGYYMVTPGHTDYPRTTRCIRANLFAKKVAKKGIRTFFHSIHGNAYGVESVNGIEVYTSPGQTLSDPIATEYFFSLQEKLMWKMRPGLGDGDPDKEAKFTVLVKTAMPAILSENGFFTNFQECINMLSHSNMSKIVQAFKEAHETVIYKNILNR